MADEHVEGNSPRNTSEATSPHVDDSPEMVNQPSPPEERVTSSSDSHPPEIADSPVEPRVSSSFEQDQSVSAGPSSLEAAGQISSDPAPEIENPPRRDSESALPTAQPELPLREEPVPSTDEGNQINVGELIRAVVEVSLKGFYEPFTKRDTKRNVDEESEDANQKFDAEDSSPASKFSSENVDLGSHSSATGSGAPGEERASGSGATEVAGLGSDSSPRIEIVIEKKSSLEFGIAQNVSLEGELPSSKTSLAIPVSGAGATIDAGLKSESFPSKIGPSSLEGSSSASCITEKVSPKRKSPSKDQHLPPKRSTQSTSPSKLQKQSDSQMSTLLEELDIKETKGEPGSSEPISGHEQNIEMEESNESETGETEQESNMEVEETDSQEAQGETTEKCSKKDCTEIGERE